MMAPCGEHAVVNVLLIHIIVEDSSDRSCSMNARMTRIKMCDPLGIEQPPWSTPFVAPCSQLYLHASPLIPHNEDEESAGGPRGVNEYTISATNSLGTLVTCYPMCVDNISWFMVAQLVMCQTALSCCLLEITHRQLLLYCPSQGLTRGALCWDAGAQV